MMSFLLGEQFYRSAIQQPLLLWVGQLLFLWPSLKAAGRRKDWVALLIAVAALDAWLTADTVLGIGTLSAGVARWFSIAFVIFGDWRYLRYWQPRKPSRGIAVAFIIPIIIAVCSEWGVFGGSMRLLFWTYETLFLFGLGGFYLWDSRVKKGLIHRSQGLSQLSAVVFATYVLWWTADSMLLCGVSGRLQELAWAMRIAANLLYYVGYAPAVAFMKV